MDANDKVAGSLLDAYRDEYHRVQTEAIGQVETTGKTDLALRAVDLWDCVRRLSRGAHRGSLEGES